MRTFNLRLVLWLTGIAIVSSIAVHFLHDYQIHRNAGVYLDLATKKARVAWESQPNEDQKKQGDRTQATEDALKYYQRYLTLDPEIRPFAPITANCSPTSALRNVPISSWNVYCARMNRMTRFANRRLKWPSAWGTCPKLNRIWKYFSDARRVGIQQPFMSSAASARCGNEKTTLRKSFEAAIAASPDRLSAYWLLAELLRDRRSDADAAKQAMEALVAANPKSADAHLMYARYVLDDKDLLGVTARLTTATNECSQAVALDPQHADGLALASFCAQQERRFDDARTLLRKSLDVKPQVAKRYLQLAHIELLANSADQDAAVEAAIRTVREGIAAISDKTATFDLRWRLVEMLIGKDRKTATDTDEISTLRAALQHEQPDSPLLAYLDARKLFADEKWGEAQTALETNRGRLTQWPDLQEKTDEMLGICYERSDNADQQVATYRRLLNNNPLDVDARQRYAQSLASAGQLAAALKEYEQISRFWADKGKRVPEEVFKHHFTLQMEEMWRRPKSAREWTHLQSVLAAAAKEAPRDPWFPLMSAELSVAEGNLDVARQILESAATTIEHEPSLRAALVDLAQEQNNPEEAARRLADLESRFGNSIATRLAQARCLIQQKGPDGLPELARLVLDLDKLPAAEREPEQLAQLHWQLAQLCWSQQDVVLGCQYGRQAADMLPKNLALRLVLLKQAAQCVRCHRGTAVGG